MKFYTKTGDSGETGLMDGSRVPKTHPRVEAFGTVDELNSFIGLAIQQSDGKISKILDRIQDELFTLGAQLADPRESGKKIEDRHVQQLEDDIQNLGSGLSQNKFVLPSGKASIFHVCRTVARRAERRCLGAADPLVIKYLNRLSSLFYTAALKVNEGNEKHPTYK